MSKFTDPELKLAPQVAKIMGPWEVKMSDRKSPCCGAEIYFYGWAWFGIEVWKCSKCHKPVEVED